MRNRKKIVFLVTALLSVLFFESDFMPNFTKVAFAQVDAESEHYCTPDAYVVYGQTREAATNTPVPARMQMGVWSSVAEPGTDGSWWYSFRIGVSSRNLVLGLSGFENRYIPACYGPPDQVYWRCEDAPRFSLGPQSKCLRIDVNLYKKGVLYGTVRDTNGQVPAIADIQLKNTPGNINQYIQYNYATGVYTATGLVPRDAYKLSVYAQTLQAWYHYDGTTNYNRATPITVGPDEQKRLDLLIPATKSSYRITGRVIDNAGQPLANVVIRDNSGLTTRTGSDGVYTFLNVTQGAHQLTASKTGFTFTPLTRSINIPPSATGQDFTATPQPAPSSISGKIVDTQGNPLPNITVTTGSGVTVQSDSNGLYTFTNLPAGTYVLTPSIEGFTVTPLNRTVTVPPNGVDQNFIQCGNLKIAQDYAPIMFFHPDEIYRPIAVDVPLLQHANLVTNKLVGDILVPMTVKAAPLTVADLLNSDFNTGEHWLDFDGDENDGMAAAYNAFHGPSLPPQAYARIFCPPTDSVYGMVVQYWFFYYDNPWIHNRHEGDWEMVQVMLDDTLTPVAAGYSNHYTGLRRPWQDVNKQGTNPFVYVALSGHGSYFFPGIYPALWNGIDLNATDVATTSMQPSNPILIRMIPQRADQQSWLYFDGHWGKKFGLVNSGPQGPRHRVAGMLPTARSLWDDPVAWFNDLEESNYITIILDSQPDRPRAVNYSGSNGLGSFQLMDLAGQSPSNQKSFTVEPGSYTVTERAANGWFTNIVCTPTSAAVVAPGGRAVTITAVGGDYVTCTFINQRVARIQAKKFNDLNRNGARNSTDSWLDGWAFNLYDSAGASKGNQVTANGGTATFANLLPGTYTLCEVQQAGWLNTRPRTPNPLFGNQPCTSITVAPGESKTALFGNAQGAAAAEDAPVPANPIYITTLPDTDDEGNELGVIEDNVPEDEEEAGTNTTPEAGTKIFLPFIQR